MILNMIALTALLVETSSIGMSFQVTRELLAKGFKVPTRANALRMRQSPSTVQPTRSP